MGSPPLEQKSQFSEKSFPVQIRQLLPAQKQPLERTHWPELQDVGEPGFQLLSRFPKASCRKDSLTDPAFSIPCFPGIIRHLLHLPSLFPFRERKGNPFPDRH